jgi:hypothetical protein
MARRCIGLCESVGLRLLSPTPSCAGFENHAGPRAFAPAANSSTFWRRGFFEAPGRHFETGSVSCATWRRLPIASALSLGSLSRIMGASSVIGGGVVASLAMMTRSMAEFARSHLALHYTARESRRHHSGDAEAGDGRDGPSV